MREQELLYKMPKELDHHCAKMLIASIDNMVDKRGVRRLVLDFDGQLRDWRHNRQEQKNEISGWRAGCLWSDT